MSLRARQADQGQPACFLACHHIAVPIGGDTSAPSPPMTMANLIWIAHETVSPDLPIAVQLHGGRLLARAAAGTFCRAFLVPDDRHLLCRSLPGGSGPEIRRPGRVGS